MAQPGSSFLSPDAVDELKNMPQLYNIREELQFMTVFNETTIYILGTSGWDQIDIYGTPGVVINSAIEDMGYKTGDKITIKDQEFTVTGTFSEEAMEMGILVLNADKALPLNDNKTTSITANTRGDPGVVKDEIENNIDGDLVETVALNSQMR